MRLSVSSGTFTAHVGRFAPVLIGLSLLVAGCERSDDNRFVEAPVPSTTPAVDREEDPNLPSTTDVSPSATEDSRGMLAIDGEGLRMFLVGSGSARALPFGTSYEVIRRTVSATLGSDPIEEGASVECQTRYARWPGGFTTWYIEDRFVGWALDSDEVTISTVSGMRVGSPRSDVESAYAIEVFESSLGTEFTVGGMAGLLDGEGPNARVTHLWAGQVCIAR